MLLSRLLSALPQARVTGPVEADISDIAYDSRQVNPGSLFVAVPTVGGDPDSGGARFLAEVISRGACAVVVQGEQAIEGVPVIHVDDARAALADCAAEFFGHPSRSLQLYAVTGTDGKTTTTYLLEQILAHAGWRTGLIGTVETKIGEERARNVERMTTPESLDLQRLLRRMVDAGVSHASLEASSHALALNRLRGCRFAACAITNISADHVEFHGSWQHYFDAKASLFTEVGRDRPAVLNRDEPCFERLAALVSGPITSYSRERDADVCAADIQITKRGVSFVLRVHGGSAYAELTFPGLYNLSNALAAAGLALRAGLEVDAIAAGLTAAHPPPGRLERVSAGQPFDVLIDYAHTMNAFQSVLATVRDWTPGKLIAVFGAAGDRDRAKRPAFARMAARYADLAIVTNEDPYGEEPDAIIDEVLAGAPEGEDGKRFRREPDRARAIQCALQAAGPGDTVLILGKGHEQSIVVNGHREPWSDVAAVRRMLEARS